MTGVLDERSAFQGRGVGHVEALAAVLDNGVRFTYLALRSEPDPAFNF